MSLERDVFCRDQRHCTDGSQLIELPSQMMTGCGFVSRSPYLVPCRDLLQSALCDDVDVL
jgi:hypothetical protein